MYIYCISNIYIYLISYMYIYIYNIFFLYSYHIHEYISIVDFSARKAISVKPAPICAMVTAAEAGTFR